MILTHSAREELHTHPWEDGDKDGVGGIRMDPHGSPNRAGFREFHRRMGGKLKTERTEQSENFSRGVCTMHSRDTNSPILAPVGSGRKQTIIDAASAARYDIDVVLRLSSNMSLNCRLGPDKNIDDINDITLPDVYRKTKGAGFPATSLTNKRKEAKVIRYPHEKHMMNPYILLFFFFLHDSIFRPTMFWGVRWFSSSMKRSVGR